MGVLGAGNTCPEGWLVGAGVAAYMAQGGEGSNEFLPWGICEDLAFGMPVCSTYHGHGWGGWG